jgi:hypothetical protein
MADKRRFSAPGSGWSKWGLQCLEKDGLVAPPTGAFAIRLLPAAKIAGGMKRFVGENLVWKLH